MNEEINLYKNLLVMEGGERKEKWQKAIDI
jgi:hypothetical protein